MIEAIEQLGADPTAVTPSGDIVGVEASGLFGERDALLTAELSDNDGWKMLIAMAEAIELQDLAQRFSSALAEEDQHLVLVRRRLAERLELQLGAKVPALEFGEPARPGA